MRSLALSHLWWLGVLRLSSSIFASLPQRDSAFSPLLGFVTDRFGEGLCPPEGAAMALHVAVAAAQVEVVLALCFPLSSLSVLFCCCFMQFSSVSVKLTISLCSFGLCSSE